MWVDTDPIVLDRQCQRVLPHCCRQFDVTSRVAVLGRVRQQVGEDLRQPQMIDFQPDLFVWQADLEMLVLGVEFRPHCFDSGVDHRDERQRLLPEL